MGPSPVIHGYEPRMAALASCAGLARVPPTFPRLNKDMAGWATPGRDTTKNWRLIAPGLAPVCGEAAFGCLRGTAPKPILRGRETPP
jgi:hypothetical protein